MAAGLQAVEERHGDHLTQIWRLLAFLGRYGYQDATRWLHRPMPDVIHFARALGYMLDSERKAVEGAARG